MIVRSWVAVIRRFYEYLRCHVACRIIGVDDWRIHLAVVAAGSDFDVIWTKNNKSRVLQLNIVFTRGPVLLSWVY
jgi:hypothetical protein